MRRICQIYLYLLLFALLTACSGPYDKELSELVTQQEDAGKAVARYKAEMAQLQTDPKWIVVAPLVASSGMVDNLAVAEKTIADATDAIKKLKKEDGKVPEPEWRANAGEVGDSINRSVDLVKGIVARTKVFLAEAGNEKAIGAEAARIASETSQQAEKTLAQLKRDAQVSAAAAEVFGPIVERMAKIAYESDAVAHESAGILRLDRAIDLRFKATDLGQALVRESGRIKIAREELLFPYKKFVESLESRFSITVARESWNNSEDGSRTHTFAAIPIDQATFKAAATMSGDGVIAKMQGGIWYVSAQNIIEGFQGPFNSNDALPSGDNEAVLYVNDLSESYKVRYREEKGGKVTTTGWEEVPEALYRKLVELGAKPVMEKPAGAPMSSVHLNY